MQRPRLLHAELAVLPSALADAKRPSSSSAQPVAQQRPFWGLLALKLRALIEEQPPSVRLSLPERHARREV